MDIFTAFMDRSKLCASMAASLGPDINKAVQIIIDAFNNRHKLLLFGNGGSAADAQHIAAEFVNRFIIERRPLPAIALTTDSSVITSIANDYSFDDIFSKQIRALGLSSDVAIGISTSGRSKNVLNGLIEAERCGMVTILLTGGEEDYLDMPYCDVEIKVRTTKTPLIQEVHIMIGHIICEMVDEKLFKTT